MSLKPYIVGLGSHLPARRVTNDELAPLLDTTTEWMLRRTGIEQRFWADPSESATDLGLVAAKKALDDARMVPGDLDLILFATLTPDHEFPGNACFLQAKLGAPGIPAIDVRQQCGGFVYGLELARHLLAGGTYKRILLVAAELQSKCMDLTPRSRDVSILFGDGAGAVVLSSEPTERPLAQLMDCIIGADGSKAKELWCPGPGTGFPSATRIDAGMLEEGLQFPRMNGKAVFVEAVTTMSRLIGDILGRNMLAIDDVSRFVLHQANNRISLAIAEQTKIAPERFYSTVQRYGNTTAASIPLGLAAGVSEGIFKDGDQVVLATFGSGFTWGAALLHWLGSSTRA
jgi:3-oxoacyl-[acyl-carrier-protein] synthase-3